MPATAAKKKKQLTPVPGRFGQAKRRLPATAELEVDEVVKRIITDPLVGEPKVGALKGVRVVKLKIQTLQLLLAYQFDAKRNVIEVLDIGPHENFYRELQKYLDAR